MAMNQRQLEFMGVLVLDYAWWQRRGGNKCYNWAYERKLSSYKTTPFESVRKLLDPDSVDRQGWRDQVNLLLEVGGISAVRERSFASRVLQFRNLFTKAELTVAANELAWANNRSNELLAEATDDRQP